VTETAGVLCTAYGDEGLNGTHELLLYAGDVHPLRGNINTINKNAEVF
jgi:hypothetical protein